MDDEDFNGIMAGLGDAIAFAGGDTARGRIVSPPDVKAIRRRVRLTQGQFAATYKLPLGTVRDWEQGRRQPETGSRLYLRMIEADPKGVQSIIAKVAP